MAQERRDYFRAGENESIDNEENHGKIQEMEQKIRNTNNDNKLSPSQKDLGNNEIYTYEERHRRSKNGVRE